MGKDNLYEKIDQLPEHLKSEVKDFVDFLLQKNANTNLPENLSTEKRRFGALKEKINMLPGFDLPLDDFKDYM